MKTRLFVLSLLLSVLPLAYGQNLELSELDALTSLADGDLFLVTDVSDTTASADGTSKKITFASIKLHLQPLDADLTALAAVTGTNTIYYRSASNTWTAVTIGSGLSFAAGSLSVGDLSATYQPLDADLTTWAGITPGSGVGTFLATPSSANFAAAVTGETGTGALVFGSSPSISGATLLSPSITTPAFGGAMSFPDGVRQTFNPDATVAGLNVGAHTADPSTLVNGDLWYNSTGNLLKARINGATVSLGAGGSFDEAGNYTLTGTWDFTGATVSFNAFSVTTLNATSLSFEGATADAFETAFGVTDPTADRTINLPNASGTVALAEIVTKNTAASYTVGTTDPRELYGGVIYVTGAATITVPAVAAGASFTVITIGAIAVSVDPNAADLIYLDGTALSDGDKITNLSTAGDIAVFTYFDATGWYAATNGWTDGN